MHRLQQHILSQLILNPKLRYAKIKPAEVEGNLFMYHLRQLMKDDLVSKASDGQYELSPSGKVYADQLSLKTFRPRLQPRIVSLVAVQNDRGEWLLYRRKRQPLIGQIGFPYGKLHIGETILEAAHRELKEKTGLESELTHRGDGYITIHQDGEIVSQIFFHLFYGQNPTGRIYPASNIGETFWAKLADIPASQMIISVPDLIKLLADNPTDRFFCELTY